MDKEINKRITYYRKKLRFSQAEIAEKVGMKSNAYSRAEREGNISCEMAKKLAEIFNIDIKQLLYEDIESDELRLLKKFEKELNLENLPDSSYPILAMNGYETKLLTMFKNCNKNKQKVIMGCVYSIYKSDL